MPSLNFTLPDAERGILWRYFDGVSQTLAKRFEAGSPPSEENLTFLLCELLDEGTTGLHMLDYPLMQAKQDLAEADGGITLDVSFQTHDHSKYVEHHYSGADLGLVFVIDHPYFGRSERAVLLQAKRLFPDSSRGFSLNSAFSSFHVEQREFLQLVERRFSVSDSIFYLWYAPTSAAFGDDHGKLIRALEAGSTNEWGDVRGWHPFLDELIALGWSWYQGRPSTTMITAEADHDRLWRARQPAARVSSLAVVGEVTASGNAPRLTALYQARSIHRGRRSLHRLSFEPLAMFFLLGLTSNRVGSSSANWIRLARGEKVPLPLAQGQGVDVSELRDLPELVPAPRHSLTFTLRSSLPWPEDLGLPR